MEALRGSDCFYLMDPLNKKDGGWVKRKRAIAFVFWAIIELALVGLLFSGSNEWVADGLMACLCYSL
jgi:hypothetical protein